MNIPEAAIESAAEAFSVVRGTIDERARRAIEAAMPAIEKGLREAIAQEIEASVAVTDHPDGSFSGRIYHAQYTHGIEDAARIVRGGTQ